MTREQVEKIKELAENYASTSRYVAEAEAFLNQRKDERTTAWNKLSSYLQTERVASELNVSATDGETK